jgi:hypothetical protein
MSFAIMHSGTHIDVFRPQVATIRLKDIAAHLAKLCTYNGATNSFYSEAQHACIVADHLAREEGPLAALYGLLHDAALAFDVPEPAQRCRLNVAVLEACDLDTRIPDTIIKALIHTHAKVVLSEMRQLLAGRESAIAAMERGGITPLRIVIRPITWDRAMDRFIDALRGYVIAAGIRPMPSFGDLQ